MGFCTISVLPLACMHNSALFCYVSIIPAQFLHSAWRMGRSHVVSSCSVFSVLIIILYAELYIYLMSITIQTFLRDSFFKNGNFFALFFFTLCIIFFMGEVTLESRSLGQLLTILRSRQSLTSIVCFHYLQQQSESQRQQSSLHRSIHFQDKHSLFPK